MPSIITPKERSPIGLIQEELWENPHRTLVSVMMLNQTGSKAVRKVIWKFFEKWPDAKSLAEADENEVAKFISPLGLQNRRAKLLRQMSVVYVHHQNIIEAAAREAALIKTELDDKSEDFYNGWKIAGTLPGVGEYARDSYDIFVMRFIEVGHIYKDKELKRYVAWALERQKTA